ncbi:hypothetical protein IMSHALPRED_010772 [Imshaugia aleurites]|uniref:Uncharacterized protein n=1 Tax=Imshaugia aleurites TaxID=172621 RepID=A0A8H3G604_9LECA|nr:hypothetical protein IMSHALPRED_010772 [Imshaugia aleurites]
MAQFLRFRGVCRYYHQIVVTDEKVIVRRLLKGSEFRLAGQLFGCTGPETENYKHLFGLKRRCSVVDTLAKFLSEYSLAKHGEDDQFVEIKTRPHLLLLTHCLERHRSYLRSFVSDPNNGPRLGVPNEEIEALTFANYNYKAAYLLSGLHSCLIRLLEERLEEHDCTLLDESPKGKYAELLVLGGIEFIRDSILPKTLTERQDNMEKHMERACSAINNTGSTRLSEPPTRTVDLALVLGPIMPRLHHQTAVVMCDLLPKDNDILQTLFVRLPKDPSALWQVDTHDAVHDFKLEVSPRDRSAVSELSPLDGGDSEGWLDEMVDGNFTVLTQVQ